MSDENKQQPASNQVAFVEGTQAKENDAKPEGAVIGTTDTLQLKEKNKANISKTMIRRIAAAGYGPISAVNEYLAVRRIKTEAKYLKKEEIMKQDLERYQMELEEQHTWLAYELRDRNFRRLVAQKNISQLQQNQKKKEEKVEIALGEEAGLSFSHGVIRSDRRPENSPAKYHDLKGHTAAVLSCKLSKCLQYVLSCGADKQVILWLIKSGKAILTYKGHTKRVNDCEIHPSFQLDSLLPLIISCSGDATIRIWNSVSETAVKVIRAHAEAVYRCSLSPDGQRILSCSEDQTIRTWAFPDGFLLFVYRAHQAPITAVAFSPSGRFIVSGSDYGERRLLLWDGEMPRIENTTQLPHMFFWTRDGLIKKVIIRRAIPHPSFWLTAEELDQLSETQEVEVWPAEKLHTVVPDDGDDSDEEEGNDVMKEDEELKFRKFDVLESRGVFLTVLSTDRHGVQDEAKEYSPGGSLVISLQTVMKPIADAFFSVNTKDALYDCFSPASGQRLGYFKVDAPLPGDEPIVDPVGIRKPYRVPPPGLSETANRQACMYKELSKKSTRVQEAESINLPKIEIVWMCPGPECGAAVVTVSFRLRGEKTWTKLQHSLWESPLRVGGQSTSVFAAGGESVDRFKFDQVARHAAFWDFVREGKWDFVKTFIDKKCACYYGESPLFVTKRKYILLLLQQLFLDTSGLIIPPPFIHKAGTTRGTLMTENSLLPTLDTLLIDTSKSSQKKQVKANIIKNTETLDASQHSLVSGVPSASAKERNPSEAISARFSDVQSSVQFPLEGVSQIELDKSSTDKKQVQNEFNTLDMLVLSQRGGVIPIENSEAKSSTSGTRPFLPVIEKLDQEKESVKLAEQSVNTVLEANREVDPQAFELINSQDKPLMNSINRPKNGPLHLPQIIFKQDVKDTKKLKNQVRRSVFSQFKRVRALRSGHKYSSIIEEEVRAIGNDPAQVRIILSTPSIRSELPEWLIQIFERMDKEQRLAPHTDPMKGLLDQAPRPDYYPVRAGAAGPALKDRLNDLKKKKKRILESRLPNAEDVRLGFLGRWLRRRREKNILDNKQDIATQLRDLDDLEAQAALDLLKSISYISGRRNGQAALPGLSSIYPNRYYSDPSLAETANKGWEENGVSGVRKKSSVVQRMATVWNALRGVEVAKAEKPVGRKLRINEEKSDIIVRDAEVTTDPVGKTKKPEPYLNRRASFPVADGLQSFLVEGENINRERRALPLNTKDGNNEPVVNEFSAESKQERPREPIKLQHERNGLIRGFLSNGMDIAHHGTIHDVSFSPSENRVATAGGDHLIKLWDPSDGSCAVTLFGHTAAVTNVKFSFRDEMCLISAGDDRDILLWELSTRSIVRKLRGHADVIYGLSVSYDFTVAVSCSHDNFVKTWFLSPREPDPPNPPEIVAKTDTTISIKWTAPPAFNEPITAFRLQWRLGLRAPWTPENGLDIPPHYRTKIVTGLFPSATYQFRMRAVNRMGDGDWGSASALVSTSLGLPAAPERPFAIAKHHIYSEEDDDDFTLATSDHTEPSRRRSPGNEHSHHEQQRPQRQVEDDNTINKNDVLVILVWLVPDPRFDSESVGGTPTSFSIEISGTINSIRPNKNERNSTTDDEKDSASESGGDQQEEDEEPLKEESTPKPLQTVDLSESARIGELLLSEAGYKGFRIILDEQEYTKIVKKMKLIERKRHGASRLARKQRKAKPKTKAKAEAETSVMPVQSRGLLTPILLPNDINSKLKDSLSDKLAMFSGKGAFVLRGCEVNDIIPGTKCRFRVRGENTAGQGLWSKHSYTVLMPSQPPHQMDPPIPISNTISSILFKWTPPNDGGAAIDGYRIFQEKSDSPILLHRYQTTYLWDGLLPGKSYRIRIQARNTVGWSPLSEYSDTEHSNTLLAMPGVPFPPLPVTGSVDGLQYLIRLPIGPGCDIASIHLQTRKISAFEIGEWGLEKVYLVPDDVNIVNEHEMDSSLDTSLHSSSSISTGVATSLRTDKQNRVVETIPTMNITLWVQGLTADTIYECRVKASNTVGVSAYSLISHRAKTKKSVEHEEK